MSRLFPLDFDIKYILYTLHETNCTPCTIQPTHLAQYIQYTFTIYNSHLAQNTLHTLYN